MFCFTGEEEPGGTANNSGEALTTEACAVSTYAKINADQSEPRFQRSTVNSCYHLLRNLLENLTTYSYLLHTYEIINRTLQIYLRKIITSAYRHSILGIECIWSIKLIFRSTHNSSSSFDQRYENKTQGHEQSERYFQRNIKPAFDVV